MRFADVQRETYLRQRQEYWENYAKSDTGPNPLRRYYRTRLAEVYRHSVPPGKRVLEIGCGRGDLLYSLQPSLGIGVDISPTAIANARHTHPELTFILQDANRLEIDGIFDIVICSDLLNELWDIEDFLTRAARNCHPGTRLLLNNYSRLWEAPRALAEALGLAAKQLPQNWITIADTANLLTLAGFDVVRGSAEIMFPLPLPLVSSFLNRYLVKLALFRHLGITNFLVARPSPIHRQTPVKVSVIVATRNEAGNISAIFDRVPQLGAQTELIFVEGGSGDDTYATIEREIAARPEWNARLYKQTGKGKGDAVRLGFQMATGDLLMILDADLTVPPEDLPKFYNAWASGKGDFINGVRLVYPMQEKAMRFFNLIGNKFFSLAFSWLLGQTVKDTLCGTKVLSKEHYETIAANRAYFGQLDPFGDFDLIFGAARFHLKIIDLPVRYRERAYGETNIQRWRHGVLLLRMVLLAARRIRFV